MNFLELVLELVLVAMIVVWMIMDHSDVDHDGVIRYRRPSQPKIAQECDPLLRRAYERRMQR